MRAFLWPARVEILQPKVDQYHKWDEAWIVEILAGYDEPDQSGEDPGEESATVGKRGCHVARFATSSAFATKIKDPAPRSRGHAGRFLPPSR